MFIAKQRGHESFSGDGIGIVTVHAEANKYFKNEFTVGSGKDNAPPEDQRETIKSPLITALAIHFRVQESDLDEELLQQSLIFA